MNALFSVLTFLSSISLYIFLVAFGAGIWGQKELARGDFQKGKMLIWAAFIASALLCFTHVAVFIMGLALGASADPVNILFGVIWGYFAWRDWQLIQRLR